MAKNTVVAPKKPEMRLIVSLLVTALVNAVVIFIANAWFPTQVVLGTMSISHLWGVILSAATLALITIIAFPFLKEFEMMRNKPLSTMEMMVAYLVINFVGLWLITRVSEIFGLGLSSWLVVLILAAVLDFIQGFAVMGTNKMTHL